MEGGREGRGEGEKGGERERGREKGGLLVTLCYPWLSSCPSIC